METDCNNVCLNTFKAMRHPLWLLVFVILILHYPLHHCAALLRKQHDIETKALALLFRLYSFQFCKRKSLGVELDSEMSESLGNHAEATMLCLPGFQEIFGSVQPSKIQFEGCMC